MSRKLTRRRTLAALGGSAVLPFAGSHAVSGAAAGQAQNVFQHGVASGDPDTNSIVIWTRVSGQDAQAQVYWEFSRDPDFRERVASGALHTDERRDHTVKVLVPDLDSGGVFYFRFHCDGETSATGRTRTLPTGTVRSLVMAVVSCSNYPFGHFNAYGDIARDGDIEWVLHLGDYLYEYGPDGYGGESGRALGREHLPRRETLTLEDYRRRHAQYKGDPQSQLMHAAHPLLTIWDDHESANNPWHGGAENHQPQTEGDWSTRRAASLQAWYEWMPVRDPAPGHSPEDYWRSWRFGDLATMVALESRHSGRAQQIDYPTGAHQLRSIEEARAFLETVVGAAHRPMLSAAMEDFLIDALAASRREGQPWRLLANQIPMARTHHPRLPEAELKALCASLPDRSAERLERLAHMGTLGLPLYLDPWDGYPRARERLYRRCREQGIQDLLVLSGDSHSFWLNQLRDAGDQPMGLELGVTAVTSPGSFAEFGPDGVEFMDRQLSAANPEVIWTDGRSNGYLRLALAADSAVAEYLGMQTIAHRNPDSRVLRNVSIARARNTLQASDI